MSAPLFSFSSSYASFPRLHWRVRNRKKNNPTKTNTIWSYLIVKAVLKLTPTKKQDFVIRGPSCGPSGYMARLPRPGGRKIAMTECEMLDRTVTLLYVSWVSSTRFQFWSVVCEMTVCWSSIKGSVEIKAEVYVWLRDSKSSFQKGSINHFTLWLPAVRLPMIMSVPWT